MMVFTIRENILPFRKQRVVIGTLIHAIHYFLSLVSRICIILGLIQRVTCHRHINSCQSRLYCLI